MYQLLKWVYVLNNNNNNDNNNNNNNNNDNNNNNNNSNNNIIPQVAREPIRIYSRSPPCDHSRKRPALVTLLPEKSCP